MSERELTIIRRAVSAYEDFDPYDFDDAYKTIDGDGFENAVQDATRLWKESPLDFIEQLLDMLDAYSNSFDRP